MKEEIIKFLNLKGFEISEKKTVVQAKYKNLVGFSFSFNKCNVIVKFPLFKREDKGAKSTHKSNHQRDAFISNLKKNNEYCEKYFDEVSPTITFSSYEEFFQFQKRNSVIKLIKEYSEFSEVNSEFELGEEKNDDGVIVKYRSNIPTEYEIVKNVFLKKEYERKGLSLEKDDVVLDLGGNIGCFSLSVYKRVKQVIVYEPEAVNHAFIQENKDANKADNIIVYNKAVIGGKEVNKDFFVGKVPYYYSFLVTNNRKKISVECVNINDVMKKYKPTKIKIDIEGSEFSVLMNCNNFYNAKEIIFEYNFDMNKDLSNNFENFDKLKLHLKKNGFNVDSLEKYSKSKSWAEVFHVFKK